MKFAINIIFRDIGIGVIFLEKCNFTVQNVTSSEDCGFNMFDWHMYR